MKKNSKKSILALIVVFAATVCVVTVYLLGANPTLPTQASISSNSVSLSVQIGSYSPPLSDSPSKEDSQDSDTTEHKSDAIQTPAQVEKEADPSPAEKQVESAPQTTPEKEEKQDVETSGEDVSSTPDQPAVTMPEEQPNEQSNEQSKEDEEDGYIVTEDLPEESEETEEQLDEQSASTKTNDRKGTVRIYDNGNGKYVYGDTITLSSKLSEFDDESKLEYQWQVNKGDGWQDVDGANHATYHFVFTEDNSGYSWRLTVQQKAS